MAGCSRRRTAAPPTRSRRERLHLEHWAIDEATLTRRVDGSPADLDAQAFVVEFAPLLGDPGAPAPDVPGGDRRHPRRRGVEAPPPAPSPRPTWPTPTSRRWSAAMTEGHPGFVANNGRIGFGLDDHEAYAPESGAPGAAAVGGRPPLAHPAVAGRGTHRAGALRRRARRRRARPVRQPAARARARPGRLPAAAGCTRGSGATRWPSPSLPTSPGATSCSSGRGPTSTRRSSRCARSSTCPGRSATT